MTENETELVLVSCREYARRGVPFSLIVTDKRISYTRLVSFQRQPTVTINSMVAFVSGVVLKRRSPWVLWGVGLVLLAFGLFYVGWFIFGTGERSLDLKIGLFTFLLAFGCFAGGRSRYVLKWREGDRRHRVMQPMSYNTAVRDAITAALRETARLLSEPAAFDVAVARAREQASVDEPVAATGDLSADSRRLCSDGACTGLIGDDGRCKVCRKPG